MIESAIVDFLAARRSVLARELVEPGPSADELSRILEIAARVPDHGRLVPWRFIVFDGEARAEASVRLAEIAKRREPDIGEARLEAERTRFTRAPVVVCVVSRAGQHPKIPEWEQVLSAGAVCQNLLITAGAMGYGAQWITEWFAYDEDAHSLIGLEPHERIAGFVYVGSVAEKPTERPRPDMAEIVRRWSVSGNSGADDVL